VARALGRRGLRVAGADRRWWEIGGASRFVHRVDWSFDALRDLRGAVVYPCGDPELAWLMAHRSELSHLRLPPSIVDRSADATLDKRILYARCLELGVPMPRTWIGRPVSEVIDAARFPVLVKPALGGAGIRTGPAKLAVCRTAAELQRWHASADDLVFQEWIDGPDDQLEVCALNRRPDGSVGALVTARKERQWPRGTGSGSSVVTTEAADVATASRELVTALGLTGLCAVEWKRSDGRLIHIEINARPVLWGALADSVLLDDFCARTGRTIGPSPRQSSQRWRYLVRDLAAGGSIHSPADHHALVAHDDPLPGLLGPAYSAALWVARRTGRR